MVRLKPHLVWYNIFQYVHVRTKLVSTLAFYETDFVNNKKKCFFFSDFHEVL